MLNGAKEVQNGKKRVVADRKASAGFPGLIVALILALISVYGAAANAAPQSTIWSSDATPGIVDAGGSESVELGVQFRSDVAGTISGLRFYKSAGNTGTHVGNLWASNGTLLATATFVNESASGWQTVTFSPAVSIQADTVYVASYHANAGHFSVDLNAFTSAGVDNAPLHALQNGISGGNGVYKYGATSAFPNSTYYGANYWVDVVFTAQPTACPCTIWSSNTVPTSVDNGPDSPVELGVKFTSSSNGTITGLRFYKSGANTGTHVGNLWSSTGALLASATFTNETGSGWQQVSFATPVAITANTTYVVSYHAMGGHYSADLGFFAKAVTSTSPLQALSNSVNSGNGVYMYGNSSTFPKYTYQAANYWVDVVFSTTAQGQNATNSQSTSNSSSSTTTVPVTSTLILNTNATSLVFGSVNVSTSSAQTVTLTNAGTGNVTISGISVSGAGFNATGVPSGTVLMPGQSAALTATFTPAMSGSVSGAISIGSNATGGSRMISLAGTGTAVPVAHSVMLSWSPSTSAAVGYNVYATTVTGGSYSKLNTSPVSTPSFTDTGIATAQTRYYVVTTVDSNNNESAFSSEVTAIIP